MGMPSCSMVAHPSNSKLDGKRVPRNTIRAHAFVGRGGNPLIGASTKSVVRETMDFFRASAPGLARRGGAWCRPSGEVKLDARHHVPNSRDANRGRHRHRAKYNGS